MSGPIGRLAKLARKAVEPIAIKALLARERLESGVSYHPGSAEILADPYPKYAQMRQQDPVHRMRLLDEMEGRIVFKTILRRFRSLRLAGEPKRREQISLRGVEELWVEVEAGSDG